MRMNKNTGGLVLGVSEKEGLSMRTLSIVIQVSISEDNAFEEKNQCFYKFLTTSAHQGS